MNLCLQKSRFWFYRYKRMAVIRHRKAGLLIVLSFTPGWKAVAAVLFDLQSFGVKNLTATTQTMEVTQYCTWDAWGASWQRAINSAEVGGSRGENSLKERETVLRKNMLFHVEKWSQYACLDCKSGCWCVYYIEQQTLCLFSLVLVKTCIYKYFKPDDKDWTCNSEFCTTTF